ncbi:MAG: Rqc2 family fibronectin-binding protein [Chloroflexota bacterium]
MTFDATTMAAVRDEIEQGLLGGRVERVVLPAELSLGIEFYTHGTKRWLLASAHPQGARVHLASERLARTSDDVSPLLLLLRKYVRDGRLVAVHQPAWERVLALDFEKRDDDGTLLASRLIIEIMGRHSNIVLVGAGGKVLDSAKRVGHEISRQRTVLPGQPYAPPPPQAKPLPVTQHADDLRRLCGERAAKAGATLAQALVGALAGLSPLMAKEVVFRATGNAAARWEDAPWDAVAASLRELADDAVNRRWRPSLGLVEGEPAAFAAYELRQFPERRGVASASEAVEAFFAATAQPTRRGETGKAALRETIASLRERATRRQRSLRESLPQFEKVDRLRRWGELLFTYAHEVTPRQGLLAVEGEQIELDPGLSAIENAQRFFKDYQKAKAGMAEVPQLLEAVEAELAFLAQVATDLDLAANPAEIEEVRQELRAAGLVQAPAQGKKKVRDRALPLGRPVLSADGFEVVIGRSARQNERVTFDLGSGGDVWLHARGIPGAHVIVKVRGQEVPESTLRQAAAYAAYYSQARADANVAVDYTQQRHVRRIKGGPPGLVNYSGEKTVHVNPAPPPGDKSAR